MAFLCVYTTFWWLSFLSFHEVPISIHILSIQIHLVFGNVRNIEVIPNYIPLRESTQHFGDYLFYDFMRYSFPYLFCSSRFIYNVEMSVILKSFRTISSLENILQYFKSLASMTSMYLYNILVVLPFLCFHVTIPILILSIQIHLFLGNVRNIEVILNSIQFREYIVIF